MTGVETRTGCPEPSELAAFVEGSLDPSVRREVERHVADCAECPLVVAEAVRFLSDSREEPDADAVTSRHRHWWWIAAAVAAAVLCTPALIWQLSASRDSLRRVKQLASSSATRTVEGRLAGFGYAPFPVSRSAGPKRQEIVAFRAEAERLDRSQHARGVALLLAGDVRAAVTLLEAAAEEDPDDAELWNDLAAAHLAGGAIGDRAEFESALHAVDGATALDPALAAAQFNRGAILEHLGRPAEAVGAYRRAIALDPSSGWSEEAEFRVARLRQ